MKKPKRADSMNVKIPREIWKRLKIESARREMTISRLLIEKIAPVSVSK